MTIDQPQSQDIPDKHFLLLYHVKHVFTPQYKSTLQGTGKNPLLSLCLLWPQFSGKENFFGHSFQWKTFHFIFYCLQEPKLPIYGLRPATEILVLCYYGVAQHWSLFIARLCDEKKIWNVVAPSPLWKSWVRFQISAISDIPFPWDETI